MFSPVIMLWLLLTANAFVLGIIIKIRFGCQNPVTTSIGLNSTGRKKRKISSAVIAWMIKGGLSQRHRLEYRANNGTWKSLTPWRKAEAAIETIKFTSVNTNAVRLIQDSRGGNPGSKNMLGISEFEVYPE